MRYRYYIEKMQQTFSQWLGKIPKKEHTKYTACKSAMYCLRCPISGGMPGNPGEARREICHLASFSSKSSS